MIRTSVCAICKNERSYLIEWVAYQLVLGFEHIYIYDNVSDDGTSELLAALDALGLIQRLHWPRKNDIPPQREAYADFISRFGSSYDYALMCDIDEFLVLSAHSTVGDFLREAETTCDDIGAIVIPWLIFGTNGKENFESDMVIRRFVACEDKPSRTIKSIIAPRKVHNMRTHFPDLISGSYITNALKPARWARATPIKILNPEPGFALIHHYYTKSVEEWYKRRLMSKPDRGVSEFKTLEEIEKFRHLREQNLSALKLERQVAGQMLDIENQLMRLQKSLPNQLIKIIVWTGQEVAALVDQSSSESKVKVRIVFDEKFEMIVAAETKFCGGRGFVIKTKWKEFAQAKQIRVSVVGCLQVQTFKREDFSSCIDTLVNVLDYMPSSEALIAELYFKCLVDAESHINLTRVNIPEFRKFPELRDAVKIFQVVLSDPEQARIIHQTAQGRSSKFTVELQRLLRLSKAAYPVSLLESIKLE